MCRRTRVSGMERVKRAQLSLRAGALSRSLVSRSSVSSLSVGRIVGIVFVGLLV